MRRLLAALLVAVPSLALIGTAHAQTIGGTIGEGGVGSSVEVPGGNGSNGTNNSATGGSSSNGTGASSSSGGGSSEPATSVWTRHYWGTPNDPGFASLNQPFLCGPGQTGFQDVQTDIASGVVLNRVDGCTATPTPGNPTPVTTPPPPPPPTAAEARSLVPLPAPSFGVSPLGAGLTGLPTWLWDSNGATPRSATSTIRGYVVTSTAHPVRWTWDMADAGPASASNPPSVITASRPGTEADPAQRYTYETKGPYVLRLTVTWGGEFTYTRPGSVPVTADLGTTTRTSTRDFQVTEVRPVLIAGRA